MNNVDIVVPDLPESVIDATIVNWRKKQGDFVHRGEVLVEIETDKIILEVPAINSGFLEVILEKEGTNVTSHQVIGHIKLSDKDQQISNIKHTEYKDKIVKLTSSKVDLYQHEVDKNFLSPSVRRLIAENNIKSKESKIYDLKKIDLKDENMSNDIVSEETNKSQYTNLYDIENKTTENKSETRIDRRVPMNRLRKCIAERLLNVKRSTAMLTTFNEVNMQQIIDLRKKYSEIFKESYNTRLGFMSFFVKAVLEALKIFPEMNAFIDNEDIIYHNYYDISIAVSTPRGLVTPVLKNVDSLSMSDIEDKIKRLATKGQNGKLTVEELTGGNFTITNGGVFGSLMSTPIINPPQSGILGIHAIKDRPMAINGKVVILPMMYLALSYDHRIIDGRDSVKFLIKVKESLENPIRLLLKI